jgi:hypothetical protein
MKAFKKHGAWAVETKEGVKFLNSHTKHLFPAELVQEQENKGVAHEKLSQILANDSGFHASKSWSGYFGKDLITSLSKTEVVYEGKPTISMAISKTYGGEIVCIKKTLTPRTEKKTTIKAVACELVTEEIEENNKFASDCNMPITFEYETREELAENFGYYAHEASGESEDGMRSGSLVPVWKEIPLALLTYKRMLVGEFITVEGLEVETPEFLKNPKWELADFRKA